MTVGDFVVVNTYLCRSRSRSIFWVRCTGKFAESMVDMENLFALVDEKTDVADASDAKPCVMKAGSSSFRASISVETDRTILKNISLVVDAGTTTAIVGPQDQASPPSAGFAALYDPQAGRILIDGQDLRELIAFPSWGDRGRSSGYRAL